jgi:hypothetical protein
MTQEEINEPNTLDDICARFEALIAQAAELSSGAAAEELTALKIELERVKARNAAKAPPKGAFQFKIDEFDVHTKIRGFTITGDLRTPLIRLLGSIFSNLIGNFIYGSVSKKKPEVKPGPDE